MKSQRRFSLSDLMLLVAGAAIGFYGWRVFLAMPVWRGMPDSLQWYYFQMLGAVAILTPLSISLLAMSLRQSNFRFRRVIAQPASVVGLAASFVWVANTALLLAIMGLVGPSFESFTGGKVLYYCRSLAEQTGMAVAAAWLLLGVARRLRWSTGGMDLLGWVVGACWIIMALISSAFTLM